MPEEVTITRDEYDRLRGLVQEGENRRLQFRRRDVFPAKWDGRCARCDEPMWRGDPMVKQGEGRTTRWVHPGVCEGRHLVQLG